MEASSVGVMMGATDALMMVNREVCYTDL